MNKQILKFFSKLSYFRTINIILNYFLQRISSKYLFEQATSKEDFDSLFKLRYKVYHREYNFIKGDEKEGIDKDRWDAHSIHIVAKKGSRVVGTVRLILDSEEKFRVEEYVALPSNDRAAIAEVSRLVIDKDYRGSHREVLFGLLRMLYIVSKRSGIKYWCGTLFIHTWKIFVDMGIYFNIVGPIDYWPKQSKYRVAPFFINIEGIKSVLEIKNPLLFSFITNEVPRKRNKIENADEILIKADNDSNLVRSFISGV